MRPGEKLTAPATKTLGKWPDRPAPAFVNRAHAAAAQHSRGSCYWSYWELELVLSEPQLNGCVMRSKFGGESDLGLYNRPSKPCVS
jgi:hypothetical protein